MKSAGTDLERATSFVVVAAVLFCGNTILPVVDAFQTTTKFLRPLSCSSPMALCSRQHMDRRPIMAQSVGSGTNHRQSRQGAGGRRFANVADAAVSAINTTSTNIDASLSEHQQYDLVESGESAIPPEVFFPPPDFEEGPVSQASTSKTTGRKRRAIQKMRQNRFSRPIKSRLVRTLLFPMRVLIWKPMWMVMDIFIDRLGDSNDAANAVVNGPSEEIIGASPAPQVAVTKATQDTALTEPKNEDSSISEITTSTETVSSVATRTEAVDERPEQSAASTVEAVPEIVEEEEAVPETVEEVDNVVVVALDDDSDDNDDDAAADTSTTTSDDTPKGDRWAVAAPGVDLSGRWELIVTPDFKKKYDKYLERLGQPRLVRSVALSGPVIGQTMEELIQIDMGQSLLIRGKNVRGTWDRTLEASGATKKSPDFEPLIIPIMTVDQEPVEAEAWWEDQGKSHVSWMRGVTMYGGGNFYSRRYFEEKEHEDDETVYACEGFFEFNDPKKENNELTWRFRRQTK